MAITINTRDKYFINRKSPINSVSAGIVKIGEIEKRKACMTSAHKKEMDDAFQRFDSFDATAW